MNTGAKVGLAVAGLAAVGAAAWFLWNKAGGQEPPAGQYTLTITKSAGGTTNPAPGIYTHTANEQVSIAASSESGYDFSGWSGSATGMTNPLTITMSGNKSVQANFTLSGSGRIPIDIIWQ